jgi:hypothetical protein
MTAMKLMTAMKPAVIQNETIVPVMTCVRKNRIFVCLVVREISAVSERII